MIRTKNLFAYKERKEKFFRKIYDNKNQEFLSFLHAKGKEFIEHFSSLKMRYKNLTITLLTAIFIAIAYIVASQAIFFNSHENFIGPEQSFIHENKIYVICFFTFLAILGVRLIRYMDIIVSHEQVRSLFRCIIDMEKMVKELTKPYEIISKKLYQKKFDPVSIDFLFYTAINVGIIIFSFMLLIANTRDVNVHAITPETLN